MTNTTTQNINSKHVQRPMVFDAQQLAERVAKAKAEYLEGKYEHGAWRYQAAVIESTPTLQMLLELTLKLEKEGRPLFPHAYEASASPGYYRAYFYRPQGEIDADIAALTVKIEEEYRAEIESWNASQVELLASQLYEAEKKKAADAENKKEEKAKAKALEEAQTYFASITKEGK
ncbi:hypothetical protein C1896_07825 [Pseudomonadaceae bacterium SI-3]|nr:hypothetical protein C1896_07825 [Pseudomonadaceae bacterium SI-3]